MFDPNINAAIHAQNEILIQQMEYLLQSVSQFTPQVSECYDSGWGTPEDTMEYHMANHDYQQQAFQPYTQTSPQQQGGQSKLEETMNQFIQMSMTNQQQGLSHYNQGYQSGPSQLEETMNQFMQLSLSIQQNQETRDIQLTQFLTEQNVSQIPTFQNPTTCVETCNTTSIRSVKVIGEDVGKKRVEEEVDDKEDVVEKDNIEYVNIKKNIESEYELSIKLPYPRPPKKGDDVFVEGTKKEDIIKEVVNELETSKVETFSKENMVDSELKKSSNAKEHKLSLELLPLQVPNKEGNESHYFRPMEMFSRLQITIPSLEGLKLKPKFVKFIKDGFSPTKKLTDKEVISLEERKKQMKEERLRVEVIRIKDEVTKHANFKYFWGFTLVRKVPRKRDNG